MEYQQPLFIHYTAAALQYLVPTGHFSNVAPGSQSFIMMTEPISAGTKLKAMNMNVHDYS